MYQISVVVPVYNCESYLRRCVDSLILQTQNNLEIILINDGSTDSSLVICKEYESRYPNIVVINQDNQGASVARIKGIKVARGEFIGFMDSDDWAALNMYEVMYHEAKKTGADIIQCGYQRTSEFKGFGKIENGRNLRVYSYREALYQLFGSSINSDFNFLLVTKLYRATCLKTLSLPNLKHINDVPVVPRAFYMADKIAAIDGDFIFYFQRNSSKNMSTMDQLSVSREKMVYSHIEAFDSVSEFMKENDNELYLMSVKYTLDWSLTAVKSFKFSKECREYAKKVIASCQIKHNPYLKREKKIAGLAVQFFLRVINAVL